MPLVYTTPRIPICSKASDKWIYMNFDRKARGPYRVYTYKCVCVRVLRYVSHMALMAKRRVCWGHVNNERGASTMSRVVIRAHFDTRVNKSRTKMKLG